MLVMLMLLLSAGIHCQPFTSLSWYQRVSKFWQTTSKVCYPELGCFSRVGHYADFPLPLSPSSISTTFWLFTRNNTHEGQEIVYKNRASAARYFDPRKPTKMLVHGWRSSRRCTWMPKMRAALLQHGDYNVVEVDWERGATPGWSYTSAYKLPASNTRVVGAVMARLIRWLETEFRADRQRFHVLGHSLGAHVGGYAGQWLSRADGRKLGRITGLDPASRLFQFKSSEIRLDRTDANFVDVVHTDSTNRSVVWGVGMMQACGHVDFYPNGGQRQKGCYYGTVASFCDHSRSYRLFIAAALNPKANFQFYECDSYDNFKLGKCLNCSANRCAQLGFRAEQWNPDGRSHNDSVKMFAETRAVAPYHLNHYSVRVAVSANFSEQMGDLKIRMKAENGSWTKNLLVAANVVLRANDTVGGLVTSETELAGVKQVALFLSPATEQIREGSVDRIEVLEGFSQRRWSFYGNGTKMETVTSKRFSLCKWILRARYIGDLPYLRSYCT